MLREKLKLKYYKKKSQFFFLNELKKIRIFFFCNGRKEYDQSYNYCANARPSYWHMLHTSQS